MNPRTQPKKQRRQVRAENPGGVCGYVGHMTADELAARAVGDTVDGICPACGMVHLCKEEIKALEKQKITRSQRFDTIQGEAEAPRV
jgi:hypothetical protein